MKRIKNWNLEDCLNCEYASNGFKYTLGVIIYIWACVIVCIYQYETDTTYQRQRVESVAYQTKYACKGTCGT